MTHPPGWPTPEEWVRLSPQEQAAVNQAWAQHQQSLALQAALHGQRMMAAHVRRSQQDRDRVVNTLVWIFVLGPLLLFLGVGLVILVAMSF